MIRRYRVKVVFDTAELEGKSLGEAVDYIKDSLGTLVDGLMLDILDDALDEMILAEPE